MSVGNTMMNIPYFCYDDNTRSVFKHIWVRLKKDNAEEYVEVKSSSKDWGSLDEFLNKYNPYGCVRLNCDSSDKFMNCKLATVDFMSYSFLDYVDSVEKVSGRRSAVENAGKAFWGSSLLVPMDRYKTLFAIQPTSGFICGMFTLLHIVMHYNGNWLSDGNFYIRCGTGYPGIYRVNFVDMSKAKAFLSKAAVKYGIDPLEVNVKFLQLLGML